jgi:hypothetical protein
MFGGGPEFAGVFDIPQSGIWLPYLRLPGFDGGVKEWLNLALHRQRQKGGLFNNEGKKRPS